MTINPNNTVFVSLGSNIQPKQNLKRAVELLRMRTDVQAVSSAYRTPPQGFTEQPDFLNMAVRLATPLSPITFKKEILDWIERELGRVRDPHNKNAPRTIDLDISLWNHDVLEYGDKPWHIPDPDILRFAHVAIPLAELAPDYEVPGQRVTLAQIAGRFDKFVIEPVRLDEA
jgi:dihydroneopterin aldolase/2-amino-4-hydroxy-6-hydroxymethyldihydropteridine diphosphokinase